MTEKGSSQNKKLKHSSSRSQSARIYESGYSSIFKLKNNLYGDVKMFPNSSDTEENDQDIV